MTAPSSLQELPPKWAHFCLEVERFLLSQLEEDVSLSGRRLALSFSGGADSTALLLAMRCLAPRLGCSLLAVHCDHAIRPESLDDAAHAAALCNELEIPFEVARVDVPALAEHLGTGLEDAGREARRELLARVTEERGCALALTGHQLNDLAEDQLMRQLRGAGWPALGGMGAWLPLQRILRPLLLTPGETLRSFLRELDVPWREDSSNRDPAFLRNRVRMTLLPAMLAENPSFLETAAELWRQARSDVRLFDELCGSVLAALEPLDHGALSLPVSALQGAAEAVRLRVYKACLERLGPGQPLASALRALDRAWLDASIGALLQFPGAKTASIVRGAILFRPASCS